MDNLSFTDAQEKVLEWLIAKHQSDTGETLSINQFLQLQLNQYLQAAELQFADALGNIVKGKFLAADPAVQTQMLELLAQ